MHVCLLGGGGWCICGCVRGCLYGSSLLCLLLTVLVPDYFVLVFHCFTFALRLLLVTFCSLLITFCLMKTSFLKWWKKEYPIEDICPYINSDLIEG